MVLPILVARINCFYPCPRRKSKRDRDSCTGRTARTDRRWWARAGNRARKIRKTVRCIRRGTCTSPPSQPANRGRLAGPFAARNRPKSRRLKNRGKTKRHASVFIIIRQPSFDRGKAKKEVTVTTKPTSVRVRPSYFDRGQVGQHADEFARAQPRLPAVVWALVQMELVHFRLENTQVRL